MRNYFKLSALTILLISSCIGLLSCGGNSNNSNSNRGNSIAGISTSSTYTIQTDYAGKITYKLFSDYKCTVTSELHGECLTTWYAETYYVVVNVGDCRFGVPKYLRNGYAYNDDNSARHNEDGIKLTKVID